MSARLLAARRSRRRRLKLTRFRGDPTVCVLGVHDAQEAPTLRAGVSAADGRAGPRSPAELENEFEPTAQSIHKWVAQADRDEGRRSDGLTTPEREELNRLRRENRQLKVEREILSKAAAWFARETNAIPSKGSSS